jgi:hypothetical protein
LSITAIEEEAKNVKTVVVHINIPGLKVKQSPPVVGAVKLMENCTVDDDPFKKE